jgi:phosphatidylserine/phosphatidylglycerophosphate/cardiolipin synthase-like enzyme
MRTGPLLIALGLITAATQAGPAAAVELRPCFVPDENCTAEIVKLIDAARSEVLVQAYGFNSEPILRALVRARGRGASVRVLLDKRHDRNGSKAASYLNNNGILPLIDFAARNAHNKVIVIDARHVITGSFNFKKSAQEGNADNILMVLDDAAVAGAYAANWARRSQAARPWSGLR